MKTALKFIFALVAIGAFFMLPEGIEGLSMAILFPAFLESKGIKESDFEEYSAEKMAEVYNDFNVAKHEELSNAITDKVSKEDINELRSELIENQNNQMKALNEALKAQGVAIKKLTEKEKTELPKGTLKETLKNQLEALKAEKGASKGEAGKVNFEVAFKAVGDMTFANVTGGNIPVEDRLPGVEMIPSRRLRLLDVISMGNTTSNVVSWVDQQNQEGAAGGTAEGAAKNQIDFDLVVTSESVKKRTAYIKVSTEMLDDISYMETLIRTELIKELMKDVENQVLQGNNTGQNLNSISEMSTPWAAGAFVDTVVAPNVVDVLTTANNQIKLAEHDGANAYLLNPSDVTAMRLVKATDNQYIDRLQEANGQMSLDGVPVIETTLVNQDEFFAGEFNLDLLIAKESIGIDIGLDGNDFTKNMRTVIAEWRGLNLIKLNSRTAFVKGEIAAAIADLLKP